MLESVMGPGVVWWWWGSNENRNHQAETKNLPKQEFLFWFLGRLFLGFLVTVSVIGFKLLILLEKPRSAGFLPG